MSSLSHAPDRPRRIPIALDAQTIERFWDQVDKNGPILREDLGPCWPWTGRQLPSGYGRVKDANGQYVYAHRLSYLLDRGELNPDLDVLHRCDNPPCVRPDHHFEGTAADNAADRDTKGRTARGSRSGAVLHPERRARGEHHGLHRLSESNVRSIRQQMASGESIQHIAGHFGVSRKSIYKIASGETWGWLS